MPQDRGFLLGHFGHVGKISLHHGQAVAVEIVGDAGGQVALPPVDLIVSAGLGPLHIMGAADEIVVILRVVVAEKVPLQPAEDIHLAGIAFLQFGDLCFIKSSAAAGHAVFQVAGSVAVAAETQRLQAARHAVTASSSNVFLPSHSLECTWTELFRYSPAIVTASFPVSLYGRSHAVFPVLW